MSAGIYAVVPTLGAALCGSVLFSAVVLTAVQAQSRTDIPSAPVEPASLDLQGEVGSEPADMVSWSALKRIEQQLFAHERRMQRLNTELDEIEQNMARSTASIAVQEIERVQAFALYRKRLRALNRLPQGARLLLLARAQKPEVQNVALDGTPTRSHDGSRLRSYLQQRRMLRLLTRYDKAMHDRVLSAQNALRSLRAGLSEQQSLFLTTRVEIKKSRARLAHSRQQRLAMRAGIESATLGGDPGRSLWSEAQAALQALQDKITKLRPQISGSLLRQKGKLPWPVEGDYEEDRDRKGLHIKAAFASPVQAIAEGDVVFSDWLAGYGRLLIIAHGDDIHTFMGHLLDIGVKVGDRVRPGQVVARVGDTGSVLGAGLYFAIRRQGKPQAVESFLR